MIRLEVIGTDDKVIEAYNLDCGPGATVSIAGFHGSRVYEVTEFDTTLAVRFTGVETCEAAPKEVKVEQQETEDGVKESEAEAMQRTRAEEAAKANDAKKAKAEKKEEKKPEPAPAATKSA